MECVIVLSSLDMLIIFVMMNASNVVSNLQKPSRFMLQFKTTILKEINTSKKKQSVCLEVGPLFTWKNILHVSKELFFTSQKVQPHGRKIFIEYLMRWHEICYKDSQLLTSTRSPISVVDWLLIVASKSRCVLVKV